MAKIYEFRTKQLIIDLPSFEIYEVPDHILEGQDPLEKPELDLIEKAVESSQNSIWALPEWDGEEFAWHVNRLDQLIKRLEKSLNGARKIVS